MYDPSMAHFFNLENIPLKWCIEYQYVNEIDHICNKDKYIEGSLSIPFEFKKKSFHYTLFTSLDPFQIYEKFDHVKVKKDN